MVKLSHNLKNLLYLLHDGIVDIVDDPKWCKDFTKEFDNLLNELEKEVD